jgi:hypothetical protein
LNIVTSSSLPVLGITWRTHNRDDCLLALIFEDIHGTRNPKYIPLLLFSCFFNVEEKNGGCLISTPNFVFGSVALTDEPLDLALERSYTYLLTVFQELLVVQYSNYIYTETAWNVEVMSIKFNEITVIGSFLKNNNNNNSIRVYLRANLTAQRPITKLARVQ